MNHSRHLIGCCMLVLGLVGCARTISEDRRGSDLANAAQGPDELPVSFVTGLAPKLAGTKVYSLIIGDGRSPLRLELGNPIDLEEVKVLLGASRSEAVRHVHVYLQTGSPERKRMEELGRAARVVFAAAEALEIRHKVKVYVPGV
jgi:hypothetical protein